MKVFKKNHYKVHKRMYHKVLWATLKRGKDFHKLRPSEQSKILLRKRKNRLKMTDEHKRKLSEVMKGKKPWITGKHHSKETKRKMSESAKNRKYKKVMNEIV